MANSRFDVVHGVLLLLVLFALMSPGCSSDEEGPTSGGKPGMGGVGGAEVTPDGNGAAVSRTASDGRVTVHSSRFATDIVFQVRDAQNRQIQGVEVRYQEWQGIIAVEVVDPLGRYLPAIIWGNPVQLGHSSARPDQPGGLSQLTAAVPIPIIIPIILIVLGGGLAAYDFVSGLSEISDFQATDQVLTDDGSVVLCKTAAELVDYSKARLQTQLGGAELVLSFVTAGVGSVVIKGAVKVADTIIDLGTSDVAENLLGYLARREIYGSGISDMTMFLVRDFSWGTVLPGGEYISQMVVSPAAGPPCLGSTPPETRITGWPDAVVAPGPAEFQWEGEDPDGSVAGYYVWVDSGVPRWTEEQSESVDCGQMVSGQHVLWAQAKDDSGVVDPTPAQAEFSVSRPGEAPVALFTVSPTTGSTSTLFQVNASSCSDAQDSPYLLQVRWDWDNDGIWDTSYSITKTNSHQYSSTGTKTIKVEVKDTGGLTSSAVRDVEVTTGSLPQILSVETTVLSVEYIVGNLYRMDFDVSVTVSGADQVQRAWLFVNGTGGSGDMGASGNGVYTRSVRGANVIKDGMGNNEGLVDIYITVEGEEVMVDEQRYDLF